MAYPKSGTLIALNKWIATQVLLHMTTSSA